MKRIDIIRLATIMALVLMLSSCKDEINLPYSDADKVYFEYETKTLLGLPHTSSREIP